MDVQIDAAVVIRKYQEQLAQVMHGNILLQTQVETLQAELAQVQALAQPTNGSATSKDLKDLEVMKAESPTSSD